MDFLYDETGSAYSFIYNGTQYYYVKNLQGDVMRIVDTSGTVVANYYYDAWGKVTNSGNIIGLYNPIRYRGYYYDTDTGFYYLQSRYYDPAIKRFINADAYVNANGDLLGFNMYAYCGNNPISRVDFTGQFWKELKDAFTQKIQQARGYFIVAAGISQVDTPAPGPADAVSVILIGTGVLWCLASAIGTVPITPPTESFGVDIALKSSDLTNIAKAYDLYECKKAATTMKKANGGRGNIIHLYFKNAYNGYVCCDRYLEAISLNGHHYGYLYNGIVYCNVYPEGLEKTVWINSFYDASGLPPIVEIL